MPAKVAVALGSNLGDRHAHLDFAVIRLRSILQDIRVSSYIETVPVDVPGDQPPFLNGAVVGDTTVSPRELLTQLLAIEAERGRARPFAGAARTLDLDLVIYGDAVIDEPGLIVPHPRFRERLFVLDPLVEIAPDLWDPVTGSTMSALRERASIAVPAER